MTRSELPEDWHDLMAGYALGDLDSEEAEALNRLLSEHPELAKELSGYQETLNLLPYTLRQENPPARLEEAIFATIQADSAAVVVSSLSGSSRHRWVGWGMGGVIAAAVLLLLGYTSRQLQQQVAINQHLQQQLRDTQAQMQHLQQEVQTTRVMMSALQEPRSLVYALEGTGSAQDASGYLVTVPGHRQMVLLTHNLPSLPSGKVYRVWAIDGTSPKPLYCGQFTPPSTGKIEWMAPLERCSATPAQVVITIDALTDSTESGGAPVMGSGV